MDELLATLKSFREQKSQDRKFFAALQGVDLDDDSEREDIATLKDRQAEFGIGMGLGYEQEGE
jgi:hypothetical protein